MMFLIRAGFWLAVTALFVPPGFTMNDAAWTDPLRAEIARLAPSAASDAPEPMSRQARPDDTARSAFCDTRPEACAVAAEALAFGAFIGDLAARRIEHWLAGDTLTAQAEGETQPLHAI
jgi:hypothetical protein